MLSNPHIINPDSLITTHEARRSGFLDYALRRNKESIPFIDKAKALRACLVDKTKRCEDILKIVDIQATLLEAAGISVKAKAHLSAEDKKQLLISFMKDVLLPCGGKYIDEIIYRYLLILGDSLGGTMRNIVGSIAGEKLSRNVVAALQVHNVKFDIYQKNSGWINSGKYVQEMAQTLKAIRWGSGKTARSLIYNIKVPAISKNVDIVLLNLKVEDLIGTEFKETVIYKNNYLAFGELKGGIDPAGADEHWKTANSALGRIRQEFSASSIFFIGAAIESSMAIEIFEQCKEKKLANAANLTNDNQLASLCEWLVKL